MPLLQDTSRRWAVRRSAGKPVCRYARAFAVLLAALAFAGCEKPPPPAPAWPPLPAEKARDVQVAVRAFLQSVAHDVTEDGPAAWGRHFSDTPAFFMAADGQMAFSSPAAARAALKELAVTLPHVELRWGSDLRVDALTPTLAVVASSYREVRVDAAGHRVNEAGFFTALVEFREGRWQLRNAHWSVPLPPSSLPSAKPKP